MGRSWTDEQKKVIGTRGSSLLVSAAAGSGKTAVLVERILREILDPVHPVDLDRLLIVTFTRAATSQLRERIRDAVTARYEEEPGNEQLRHQMTLLYSDHIMTIDKFFLMVIREHYQQIGLDPSFRIGDEGELKLMRADLISAVLEEAYKEGDPDFLRFSDCYAAGISDAALEGMVLDFWESSSSHPWPKEWRHACLRQYLEEPSSWIWLPKLLDAVHTQLLDILENIDQTLALCAGPGGPKAAQPALLSDRELAVQLLGERSYDQLRASFSDMKFARISKKEKKGEEPYDPVKVQMAADLRDSWKKKLGSLREKYFMRPLSEEAELMKRTGADFAVLVRLADRFEEVFSEEKTRKNLLDFTDTAHLALKVLIEKNENGDIVPTQAAREYQDYFEEIAIDEYQDSNEIQELLLSSVSRESRGVYNRFMVGDVKQSIYRFRMSDPVIFMKKYESYRKQEDSPKREEGVQAEEDVQPQPRQLRIDLHKNFRSRREVLEAVNLVFRQIMRREVGGVTYGADESLYPGAAFESCPEPWKGQEKTIFRPELILVEPGDVMDAGSESGENPLPDAMHAEAEVTAARILQMVGHDPVWDKEKGTYRPAEFRDVVILLRTASDWANTYSEVLSAHGIPNRSGSKTGYFSAPEVQTILAYLDILDNPRQDIPLAAVLRSEIGRLTDDELSMLKAGRRKDSLYDCVETFLSVYAHDRAEEQEDSGRSAGPGQKKTEQTDKGPSAQTSDRELGGGFQAQQEEALYEKLRQFREMTDRLRSHVSDTPIHQLLWQIYDETGFLAVSEASEGGSQKRANLDMLVEKAIAYEQTSYRGLFHFVRYIDKLIRYEVDFGAALAENGSEDLVRIMTIHASKGLEFPIVFVAGLGRRFNRQDAAGMLVQEAGIGVGMNYIDPDRRVQVPTLIKSAAAERVIREGIGEELRVLYVALTRAEEKLILTGTVKDRETFVKSLFTAAGCTTEKLPESLILGADSYLTWVSEALVRHEPEGGRFREMADLPQSPEGNPAAGLEGSFLVRTGLEVTARQQHAAEKSRKQLAALLFDVQPGAVYDRALHDQLKRQLGSRYPWQDLSEIPAKVTVSELKRQGYEAEMKQLQEAAPASWTQQPDRNPEDVLPGNAGTAQDTQDPESGRRDRVVPAFMQEQTQQKPLSGAAAGTVYHRVLADYDFTLDAGLDTVLRWLETMVQCDKITEGEKKAVQAGRLVRFLNSELGARMKKAAGKGVLHRENPFVLSIPAGKLFQDVEKEAGAEPVLIQGTIDAWFEEAGHLVLVDYKTDYCRPEQKESLVRRYRTQFLLYASALTRLTGKVVGEAWLYSLSLGEAIPVSLAS